MAGRALILVMLVGCIKPALTYCDDGLACSADLVCDTIHHGCVTPEQLTVCVGMPDLKACSIGDLNGLCLDQVCIVPACGDRIVEPGEQCDDGNTHSGDGCSATCTSTEVCGNGVVDATLGEQCDDGNFASHDGCDSTCQGEEPSWFAYPIRITNVTHRNSAYDPGRDRLVVLSNIVAEWDGIEWHIPVVKPPSILIEAVAYDPSVQRTILIGTAGSTRVAYSWDGTQFLPIAQTNTPSANPIFLTMAYDAAHQKLMALTGNADFYFDASTGIWQPIGDSLFGLTGPEIAFDGAINRIVVVDPSLGTHEWDGMHWTASAEKPNAQSGWSLVYEPASSRFLAIGGAYFDTFDEYIGGNWQPVGTLPDLRDHAVSWVNVTTGKVNVLGGVGASGVGVPDPADLRLEITGSSVTAAPPTYPPERFASIVYDAERDRLEMFDALGHGRVWASGWPALPPFDFESPVIYDPVRRGILAVRPGATTSTMYVLGDDWQMVADLPGASTEGLAYDYRQRRVVLFDFDKNYALSEGSTAWTRLPDPVWGPSETSSGYDVGRDTITALPAGANLLYDLVGNGWTQSLSAGAGYRLTPSLQTKSLLMIPTSTPSGQQQRQIWERKDGAFTARGVLPMDASVFSVAELSRGRMMMLMLANTGWFLLERQYTSPLADETCAATEDADGDGLAGCADPDCWWTCWPTCPLATSCAP